MDAVSVFTISSYLIAGGYLESEGYLDQDPFTARTLSFD
jgi:hypothetical protein